jgi:hypothetical protein
MGDRLGNAKKGEAERGCKFPGQVFYKSAPLFGGSKLYSPPDPLEICSPLLGGRVLNGCQHTNMKPPH